MNTATRMTLASTDPGHLEFDPLAEIRREMSPVLTNRSSRSVSSLPWSRASSTSSSTSRLNSQLISSRSINRQPMPQIQSEESGSMDLLELENPITRESITRISMSSLRASGLTDIPASKTSYSTIMTMVALDTTSRSGQTSMLLPVRSKEEWSLLCTEILSSPQTMPFGTCIRTLEKK